MATENEPTNAQLWERLLQKDAELKAHRFLEDGPARAHDAAGAIIMSRVGAGGARHLGLSADQLDAKYRNALKCAALASDAPEGKVQGLTAEEWLQAAHGFERARLAAIRPAPVRDNVEGA